MDKKKLQRDRRAKRTRAKIKELRMPRLCVNRSNSHIYVQLIAPCGSKTMLAASSVEKELRAEIKYGGNKQAAAIVGKAIAERALKEGIKRVAFDRSGFKYHGRIKALADAARESGLDF
ncbi:MAG: 50S ribosomal protein L18 [Coxiella sp. RIFCSPHIGHO2_12_FULL_42_15]|nr:MAG: 50S ribosomal protein L18 [Coxiella sp. RIFCSPHIGHO2_12_FULL_42_15]